MSSGRGAPGFDLAARLAAYLAPLCAEAACPPRLLLALSGGLDSTVLLHLLAALAPQQGFVLSACHVHHGLSRHADAWAAHCAQACSALGVPLQVCRVTVSHTHPQGLEAAAREVRYQALRAQPADWIVLAHHADDQAETLLFRLLRGTGVTGAAAMRELDPAQRLMRPLLAESRATLAQYAQAQGLVWVEDDSNPDPRFARNFLRHHILSPLAARFPAASHNLARAAQHFAEADGLLHELAAQDARLVFAQRAGSRARFGALSEARARNLLRHWLAEANGQLPEQARLADAMVQLRGNASAVRWVFGHTALCAYRDLIWREPAQLACPLAVHWQGQARLPWAEGWLEILRPNEAVQPDRLQDAVHVRVREEGLVWRQDGNRPSRSFKAHCQAAGVPPWWRAQLPCLWAEGQLQWVGGIAGEACFGRALQGWRVVWHGDWRDYQWPDVAGSGASPSGS